MGAGGSSGHRHRDDCREIVRARRRIRHPGLKPIVASAKNDRRSGQPVWWQSATGRHVEEMKAQPSRAQMDQYLLWAEDSIEDQLARGFLK